MVKDNSLWNLQEEFKRKYRANKTEAWSRFSFLDVTRKQLCVYLTSNWFWDITTAAAIGPFSSCDRNLRALIGCFNAVEVYFWGKAAWFLFRVMWCDLNGPIAAAVVMSKTHCMSSRYYVEIEKTTEGRTIPENIRNNKNLEKPEPIGLLRLGFWMSMADWGSRLESGFLGLPDPNYVTERSAIEESADYER